MLWVLNGHCNSPIAGFSTIDGAQMSLTASVLDEAGGTFIEVSRSGPADRPRELGRAVGLELLSKGAADDHRTQPAGVMDRCGPSTKRLYPLYARTRLIICSTCAIGVSGWMPWPRLKISRPPA